MRGHQALGACWQRPQDWQKALHNRAVQRMRDAEQKRGQQPVVDVPAAAMTEARFLQAASVACRVPSSLLPSRPPLA
jgi:hypothetical protein